MIAQLHFCSEAIAPIRAEAKDASEMVTQLLFGDRVEVLESDRQWRKIRVLEDQYEGWVDEKMLFPISEDKIGKDTERQSLLFDACFVLETQQGEMHLTRGADLSVLKSDSSFRSMKEPEQIPNSLREIALSYRNAPYLWGGKTLFGIDCSGFTQMVFRFLGYSLPRDANQQAELGQKVNFENRQEGDLAFFENKDGKIIHVGIVLMDGKIIHAHGKVRMDNLTKDGIWNEDKACQSHQLNCIKRFISEQ